MPVADGGEGTVDVLVRRRVRAGRRCDAFGRARTRALASSPTARRRRGRRGDPARPGAARSVRRVEPRARAVIARTGTAARCRRRRRHGDGRRRGRAARGARPSCRGPTRVACDVRDTLFDAPASSARRRAPRPSRSRSSRRGSRDAELAPFAGLPGAGAAGGLGAALASLGAELVPGADAVLDLLGFDPAPLRPRRHRRGHGRRDDCEGKAPGAVARRCGGAACAASSSAGSSDGPLGDVRELVALSGDPDARRAKTWSSSASGWGAL